VLYVLLCLIVASGLGIDVTGVVALASVLTLAISLSVQNALTNVIGGFTLLSTHPFSSGDYVETAGQAGTVQEIGMIYTKLATPDNKIVSIPNSAVVSAQIINYTITGTRRTELNVSASYDAPTQAVIDALIQAGTVDKILLDPPPFAAVVKYDTSSICYTLRLWAKTEDYWDMYFLVNQRIKDIFDSQGIAMTYPHLHVHMDK
jgi:small conductance mechanosensitive channel